jgi:CPA2 family monovalent cation:H+ antiporter-2
MDGVSLLQDFAVVLVVAGVTGWIFRRLGLSAVVGYLVAGIVIGPFTPPFTLVSDVDRIETLTDLGLAFLMFFVGMGLSFKRIRRLGIGVVAATAITAFFVFQICHGFAALMGWDDTTAFIFSAMLMASSSAIITKMLAESGLTHERFAQNAQGVTVLEDIVAIVLLTILGSRLQIGDTVPREVGDTLFLLMGFTAIVVVVGLIFVPKLLERFGKAADSDLISVLVSGMVFIAGVASIRAGFSVALGAFLFGVVVAETRFKSQIEKSLGGAQDMFSAIFFVAIGMLIDVQAFVDNAGLILGIAAFAIIARTLAATVGFVATGNPLPLAVSSAVVVTPIGEFAYVIAQIGVDAKAVPSSFYAVAVGVSIVTAICAPFFAKRAESLGGLVEKLQPRWLAALLERYTARLNAIVVAFARNHVWQLTRRRTGIALIQVILLGGLFGFANPMKSGLDLILARTGLLMEVWEGTYWIVVLILSVGLLIAIWQSLQTLCMVYADALTMRSENAGRKRAIVQFTLQATAAAALCAGVWIGAPVRASTTVAGFLVLAVLIVLSVLLRRRLDGIGIRLEQSLSSPGHAAGRRSRVSAVASGEGSKNWDLDVVECEIPEDAECAGKSLQMLAIRPRFGCSVLEIDRQGFVLDRVGPGDVLYPGDRLLLFGPPDQIGKTREFLRAPGDAESETSDFEEAILDTVTLLDDAKVVNKSLAEASIFDETGVQIMGLERDGTRTMNPSGSEVLRAGDRLLVMGSTVEIREFQTWLQA